MTRFHESVDADILAELQVEVQLYPPKDLGEMFKWKGLGVNSAEFGNQAMDPAYFKAVCPGRGDQRRSFDVQEAAAEVFGPGRRRPLGVYAERPAKLEAFSGRMEPRSAGDGQASTGVALSVR